MHVREVGDTLYKYNTFNIINIGDVTDLEYKCNALSSMHVEDVRDIKNSQCSLVNKQ